MSWTMAAFVYAGVQFSHDPYTVRSYWAMSEEDFMPVLGLLLTYRLQPSAPSCLTSVRGTSRTGCKVAETSLGSHRLGYDRHHLMEAPLGETRLPRRNRHDGEKTHPRLLRSSLSTCDLCSGFMHPFYSVCKYNSDTASLSKAHLAFLGFQDCLVLVLCSAYSKTVHHDNHVHTKLVSHIDS